MKYLKNAHGGIEIYLLFLLIIAGVAFVGGFHPLYTLNSQPFLPDYLSPNPGVSAKIEDNVNTPKQGLQLQQPIEITKAPPPTTTPEPQQPNPPQISQPPLIPCPEDVTEPVTLCQCARVDYTERPSPDTIYCFGKPVIYLYPTKDTVVNVKLDIPGTVTVSDPQIASFPTSSTFSTFAWNNVLAHPDGSLDYQNKTYHELYYESAVTKLVMPTTGIVVAKENLKQELTALSTKLGLLPNEQAEFLDYWLPRLHRLSSPYVFISVLTQQQKDLVDHVEISPAPDTFIQMLFYFKGVSTPSPLSTSSTFTTMPTPKRVGFTTVEWGGTIDTGN